jgi:mannose-1-phosphate guanylyltransferase
MAKVVPVVLSGGSGTRLWPVSREGHPKPFMLLPDGQSLLSRAYERAAALASAGELVTVTNRDYYFLSRDEFAKRKNGSLTARFVLEPQGRNTAPAVAIAALCVAQAHGEDATILVMAADHLIQKPAAFEQAAARAVEMAARGDLVTFGIAPDRPETGFGYIEIGEATGIADVFRVRRFVEKPDQARAQAFLKQGTFLWNSGMFCFQAGALLRELAQHAPDVLEAAKACWSAAQGKRGEGDFVDLPAELFSRAPNVSIDVAVMEKSARVAVVRSDIGWSDVGSWEAVSRLLDSDAAGNRTSGDTLVIDATDNFIMSEDRLVAALGVSNLMVVDTPDALLVAAKERAQDVKRVVEALKSKGHETFRFHRTVARPWGTYTTLEEGPRFKIKRIVVKPGASLSLQMHHHRSEHWVVVKGTAKVTNNERESLVYTDQSTYIPAGNRHRLENPGKVELVLIEVQSGDYVGEDDIVRLQDNYGRT